jgi:myo-inositol 2-dehydrogenase / D-chiro-inositol 1-dehydrogenase
MRRSMAFAVAGYGAWGRYHARAIAEAADARLAAIASPSEANAEAAHADFPDAVVYRSWEALLADPAIEAIAVATPNHLHAPIAIAALEAGRHVLLEKPMATSIADCDRIVAAAARAKGQLSVGLQCRLSPQWGRIHALIAEGAIGRPRHVHISLFRHPYRPGSAGWRYDKARVGSWILEEPVHFFDLALWYLARSGRPVAVRAVGVGHQGMQPTISVLLQFPDGATVAVNQILGGFDHHQTVEVVGDGGAVRATWSASTARSLQATATLRLKRIAAEDFEDLPITRSGEVYELLRQAQASVAAFRSGTSLVSAAEGRAAVAVCLAAESSARKGGQAVVVE